MPDSVGQAVNRSVTWAPMLSVSWASTTETLLVFFTTALYATGPPTGPSSLSAKVPSALASTVLSTFTLMVGGASGAVVTVDVSVAVAELLGLPTSVTLALTTSITLVPAGGDVPLNSQVTDRPAPMS